MSQGRWMISLGAFVSMSFLGMSRTFLGTALPAIRSSLDLSILQAGTLTALIQLGFTVAVFVGGPISDTFKKSSILMIGCLLMGTSLILFGLSDWFWLNLVGITAIGIGGGLIESSSNPLLIQLFRGRESMVMNLHHFFFAMGSLGGPLIMGAVLSRSIPWQWGYAGFGFFVLIIFLFVFFQRASAPPKTGGFNLKLIGRLMTDKTFVCLLLLTLFNSGTQNGICFWMVTFLKETKGLPIALAGSSLSLFFVCVAVGRLFSSRLITRFRETNYLLALLLVLFVSLLLSIFAPGKWAILSFALCGLAHSGIYPSLLAMTGKIYRETPGAAMGILTTGGGVGSIVLPWLVSFVSQQANLRMGFLTFEVYVICSLFVLGVLSKVLKGLIPQSRPAVELP